MDEAKKLLSEIREAKTYAGIQAGEFPAAVVIENIWQEFLPHRRLAGASVNGKDAKPSRDSIVEEMERFDYLRIDARREAPRGKRDRVAIFVLAPEGKYSHHAPNLTALLKGVDSEKIARNGELDEVMVVAVDEFFQKNNLLRVVREFRAREAKAPDLDGAAPIYNAHPYHVFALVVPRHVSSPKYRILSSGDAEGFLAGQRLEARNILPISADQAPMVWLGARPGQYVEVEKDSETAAVAVIVRLVTR
jgi:DNA-directed RNA polymerase subunit H (RpoH/RPB5)